MSRIHDALERARLERPKERPSGDRGSTFVPRRPWGAPGSELLAELAEQFTQECNALRSAIELALHDRPNKLIMFISAVRQEGCTTLMTSLGYTLASQAGKRVALVDANIKSPALGDVVGIAPHAGLTDVVGRDLEYESAVRSTSVSNLHVMLCGNTPLVSSEVFGSPKTSALLKWLNTQHAYVLGDMPAIMPAPEVVVHSRDADGVVLVVRANKTDRNVLEKARDILQESGANILGVVLNRRRFVIPEFMYRRL